jgi:hypothetical protein
MLLASYLFNNWVRSARMRRFDPSGKVMGVILNYWNRGAPQRCCAGTESRQAVDMLPRRLMKPFLKGGQHQEGVNRTAPQMSRLGPGCVKTRMIGGRLAWVAMRRGFDGSARRILWNRARRALVAS